MVNRNFFLKTASVFATTFLFTTATLSQTINVCQGEYSEPQNNKCLAYEAYTYCGTINAFAAEKCKALGSNKKPKIVTMRDVPGNKCGYTNFRVVCD